MKKTIVFDFDGVIHRYSRGWQDGSIYDIPNDNIYDVLSELKRKGYEIVVVSTRCAQPGGIVAIENWLDKNHLGEYVDKVCKEKPPAMVYIDDRAICYDPDANNLVDQIECFQTHRQVKEHYKKMSGFELLGMLQVKNRMFKEANDLFDKNKEKDPILATKMMDEWIQAVLKYVDKKEN